MKWLIGVAACGGGVYTGLVFARALYRFRIEEMRRECERRVDASW